MKPREQGGVVDARLNVYSVQNLKIAGNYPTILWKRLLHIMIISDPFCSDCSIAPGNVGANTYNTAIAIGEKAAVIIAEDLGIKGVTSE
jgi:alcohol oxidase